MKPFAIALTLLATGIIGAWGPAGASSATAANSPARSGSAPSLAPIHGTYSPSIDPANFVATVDNPYLPFLPGTMFLYVGFRGRTPQTDVEFVLHRTRKILGVACTVVRDTVSSRGKPVERTLDFYAQDRQGNVWYMGEDSFELRHGRFVKAPDSWQAGVNGGRPGIIMPGDPQPGDAYRQEYYPPGKALDEAHVLGLNARVKVPFGVFTDALVTSEFSPAEPQTEKKWYVKGVGEVAERVVKGHREAFRLASVMSHTARK